MGTSDTTQPDRTQRFSPYILLCFLVSYCIFHIWVTLVAFSIFFSLPAKSIPCQIAINSSRESSISLLFACLAAVPAPNNLSFLKWTIFMLHQNNSFFITEIWTSTSLQIHVQGGLSASLSSLIVWPSAIFLVRYTEPCWLPEQPSLQGHIK